MEDSNQTDLTFTRLDYLLWRVVSKAAKSRRAGRERQLFPIVPVKLKASGQRFGETGDGDIPTKGEKGRGPKRLDEIESKPKEPDEKSPLIRHQPALKKEAASSV